MNRLLFYDWRYYEILTESFLIISDKSIISLCVLCVLCGEKKGCLQEKAAYTFCCRLYYSAGWIASDGQTSAQVPQSVHTSGLIE